MSAITTIGEAGLRLSVPHGVRIADADAFDVEVIGAEFNVAAALSNLGWSATWVSAVHDAPIGDLVMRAVRRHGVDTSLVQRPAHGRTSTYYVEYSDIVRPTRVQYDRANSSFSSIDLDAIDWDELLDTRVLHATGITLGLGGAPRSAVESAIRQAGDRGVAVSLDVNYRDHLWKPDEAAAVLRPLLAYVDILFCSERDARNVLELEGDPDAVLDQLCEWGASVVVMSRAEHGLVARLGDRRASAPSVVTEVVDRLGAGDAMAAGVLHAWLDDDLDRAAPIGSLMAAMAMAQRGEQVITSTKELESLLRDGLGPSLGEEAP